jgi:hypothetical protein
MLGRLGVWLGLILLAKHAEESVSVVIGGRLNFGAWKFLGTWLRAIVAT